MELLQKVGNRVAAGFFERALPAGERPPPLASTGGDTVGAAGQQRMAAFLEEKYLRRKWAPAGERAPHEVAAGFNTLKELSQRSAIKSACKSEKELFDSFVVKTH